MKEEKEKFDLKKIRESQNVTQEELAEDVGLTRQAIGSYENGIHKPSVPVAKAIAKRLGFEWIKFFEE